MGGSAKSGMLMGLAALGLACGPTTPRSESVAQGWRFGDGEVLYAVKVESAVLDPGQSFVVRWEGSSKVGQGLIWGLAPVQDAGWQHYPRRASPHWVTPRARWWPAQDPQSGSQRLQVPNDWQGLSVTLLAYRKQGASMIPVLSGPRLPSSDPPMAKTGGVAVAKVLGMRPTVPKIHVPRALEPIKIDGRNEDWAMQGPTHPLVDSLSGALPHERGTQLRFAWDRRALYLFATMQDPDLWAPHTQRDDPLYRKEALEFFVSADGENTDYLELQISAANVIFDARYLAHRRGDRTYNGPFEHAVVRRGTLKRRNDVDKGWSAELALPWEALCSVTRVHCPIQPGTQIRVNVFRLESPGRRGQEGTALSAVYRPDFHAMDRAAFLVLDP